MAQAKKAPAASKKKPVEAKGTAKASVAAKKTMPKKAASKKC